MKRNGNAQRRRRENRGAEGAEGVGPGRVSPSQVEEGSFLIFLSGNGAFWALVLMLV